MCQQLRLGQLYHGSSILHATFILLETNLRKEWSFTITEKASTRAFSSLKVPFSAFKFKALLKHYAKCGRGNYIMEAASCTLHSYYWKPYPAFRYILLLLEAKYKNAFILWWQSNLEKCQRNFSWTVWYDRWGFWKSIMDLLHLCVECD